MAYTLLHDRFCKVRLLSVDTVCCIWASICLSPSGRGDLHHVDESTPRPWSSSNSADSRNQPNRNAKPKKKATKKRANRSRERPVHVLTSIVNGQMREERLVWPYGHVTSRRPTPRSWGVGRFYLFKHNKLIFAHFCNAFFGINFFFSSCPLSKSCISPGHLKYLSLRIGNFFTLDNDTEDF